MKYTYKTKGTCSTKITFDLDGDIVRNIEFTGGCNGNLQAVSRLTEGMSVQELQEKCAGINCGFRKTSCADQLAKAVCEAAKQK